MISGGLSDLADLALKNGTRLILREFICGRNRLEVPGTKCFSEVFAKLQSLEIIEIPQNGIQPEGEFKICQSIVNNDNIKVLLPLVIV